jgi:hypothetical protein
MYYMKNLFFLFAAFFILLLSSCLTTGETQYFSSFSFDKQMEPKDDVIDSPVELPQVELFVSAPYMTVSEENRLTGEDVTLPVESVPEIISVESSTTFSEPAGPTITTEKPEIIEVESPDSLVAAATPVSEEVSVPEVRDLSSTGEAEIDDIRYERSMVVNPGEDIVINLEREGWIFDREKSSPEVQLKSREFSDGGTRFTFSSDGDGAIVILFILQNSETGENEQMAYNLEKRSEEIDRSPVVIDALNAGDDEAVQTSGDPDIRDAVDEGNIPGIIASIGNLTDPQGDPGVGLIFDVFELLEQQGGYDSLLVELAENSLNLYPYDNSTAEMLYRAAQSLETPGEGQDIKKAVTLFRIVRDYFPLSIYSDRSEERITYLERHFMKIY